jgi:hypothetical protein
MILNDGTQWEPNAIELTSWTAAYPGIDVKSQINQIAAWCLSNPKNRKTPGGVSRFVNSWLARAQDQSGKNSKQPDAIPQRRELDDYGNFMCHWRLGERMIEALWNEAPFEAPDGLAGYQPRFNLRGMCESLVRQETSLSACYGGFNATLQKHWNAVASK